ncbi:aminotransferase class V-fold PLP-dependent enzyme [Microbulbifer bruguierae]|uniref:cysteine desulfurase n=1 Tax=Microbulbifer bruguierae TaxID=3029061 RepID=A0ABY8NH58_9GAMM|nr:aminotransferase class V-fold PLP-dependent enzyme [Microbulbifer bruguierae]WGL17392.1 aminotransferase class V-fold PLP-dependent enzyme [Microbulbifer bruguierae]
MSFSVESFKSQFPLFSQSENRELVYLDNAATTQKPACVIDAIADFYRHSNANTHRSSHRLARRATDMVEQVRELAAAFLGATCAKEVVFTRGATEGLNLLAYSLCSQLQPGDQVLLTTAEHHANLVPWQMMAKRYQLQLCYVPDERGVPQIDRLYEVLTPRTRIVSLTAGSNALGFRTDLHAVRAALAEKNIHWIVDGAQLAAHEHIDVQSIGCDFLVCSAHKFYGPTGVGLLYGRESRLREIPPWQGGGEMISDVDLYSCHYAELPHKFEAGTSSLAAIAGLGACLQFLDQQDRGGMARHEQQLLHFLHDRLSQIPEIDLLSAANNNLGIVAFTHPRCAAIDLMQWLDGRDIAVRVGHHCAQPLVRASGHSATLRASLAAYNTRADAEKFVAAVAEFIVHLGDEVLVQGGMTADSDTRDWQADDLGAVDIEVLRAQRNWQDRYRTLMGWAKVISRKETIRSEENLVRGCESSAWLVHRCENGLHRFALDSDSRIVRGLGALLLSQLDDQGDGAVTRADLESLFAELGLEHQLSESRTNGFRALLERAYLLMTPR